MAAYQLTLSLSERRAIDWIGHRYSHGNDLYDVLTSSEWVPSTDWDVDIDITFHMTEPLAWVVLEIAEEGDHIWDCFSPKLVEKMERFCESIV